MMHYGETRRLHTDQLRDMRSLQRQYPAVLAPTVSEFTQARPVAPSDGTAKGLKKNVKGFYNWFMQSEEEYEFENRQKRESQWKEQVDRDADRYMSWQKSMNSIPTNPPKPPSARKTIPRSAPPQYRQTGEYIDYAEEWDQGLNGQYPAYYPEGPRDYRSYPQNDGYAASYPYPEQSYAPPPPTGYYENYAPYGQSYTPSQSLAPMPYPSYPPQPYGPY